MNGLLLIQKVITLAYGKIYIHWKHTLLKRKTCLYLVRVYTALIIEEMIVLASETVKMNGNYIEVIINVVADGHTRKAHTIVPDIRVQDEQNQKFETDERILFCTLESLEQLGVKL